MIKPLPPIAAIDELFTRCSQEELHVLAFKCFDQGDADPDHDWQAVGQVFLLSLTPQNSEEPLRSRGAGPRVSELQEQIVEQIRSMIPQTKFPVLKARFSDIVWLRLKDFQAAKIATSAYLEAGKEVEDLQHWTACMSCYERSARLAKQIALRSGGQLALAHLEERVLHYAGNDPLYFSCKAMELLAEFRFGNFGALAAVASVVADGCFAKHDYRRARSYLLVQERLLRLADQEAAAEHALDRVAESYLNEADFRSQESSMVAHHFVEQAIRAFQNRPKLRHRVPELKVKLAELGRSGLSEMKTIEHSVDITDLMTAVQQRVSGKELADALFCLLFSIKLMNPETLEQQVIKQQKETPLSSLFNASHFDSDGRKVASRAGWSMHAGSNRSALSGLVQEAAGHQRRFVGQAVLRTALNIISQEHDLSSERVIDVIATSAFIPDGRMDYFVKGIVAGFNGDLLCALHILVPQLESSFRMILEQAGTSPRNISAEGIEELWGLDKCLSNEIIVKALGQDLAFELQSVLTSRIGPNLRHSIAHGTLPANTFNGPEPLYLFFLIVRLVLLPTETFERWKVVQ